MLFILMCHGGDVRPVCMHALACTQLCAVFHTRPAQLQLLGSERVALARRAQGTAHKGEHDIRRHVRLAVGVAGARAQGAGRQARASTMMACTGPATNYARVL